MILSAQLCLLFFDFIENNYLIDLPLEGVSFTWLRESEIPSMSRIDRVMRTRKSSRKKKSKYTKIQELWSSFDVGPS